ncbi:MAG: murein biosynthesis integral membrane protein MurJ, partial [Patescibacteria group bacterium]|nr:murein biosynthesis integral membrane protein MurJ [Patescibacteria group bacterium]
MNFSSFLNHQTKNISKAALILAISASISRILGVVRNWLLASNFGAGSDLDIYFAAFKIPDFVYNILISGGISVAFLPLFSEYYSKDNKKAWEFVSNSLNIFVFLLVLLAIVLFIFTPLLVKLVAPGFTYDQIQKTIILTRVMLLSPIFFGLSSFFSGILQYFNRFLAYSLAPIFYNLGIIFGILFLAPQFGILGVALGVILGAFLHFAIQIPSAINTGFSYRPIFNIKDYRIKSIFLLMIPRMFGISAQQINSFVITAIASTLSIGSISIFNFANDIQYFPIGIVGVSFAIAAFPVLSKAWAENERNKFFREFSLVFRRVLYLIIPISVLIFILRSEIVQLLLG